MSLTHFLTISHLNYSPTLYILYICLFSFSIYLSQLLFFFFFLMHRPPPRSPPFPYTPLFRPRCAPRETVCAVTTPPRACRPDERIFRPRRARCLAPESRGGGAQRRLQSAAGGAGRLDPDKIGRAHV